VTRTIGERSSSLRPRLGEPLANLEADTIQSGNRVPRMLQAAHMTKGLWVVVLAIALVVPTVVQAHVTIAPRQSTQGATERYTVRIPTEGTVATTGADLEVPEGVIVEVLQVPAGWTYAVERAEDRIISVRWQIDVKPGEFAEVGFVARNPREGTRIVWTLRQRFADGTVTDWTMAPNGTVRPTAVTQLAAMQRR